MLLDDLLAEVRSNREPFSGEERRRAAIHEAGHVIAGTILGRMEIVGVSIGDRGGMTEVAHIEASVDPEHCNAIIVMLMAGRAAEELLLGNPTAGAGGDPYSDLAHSTDLAKKIELKFGFGDYGPIYLGDDLRDPLTTVPGLLASVRKRLDRAMADAAELLGKNRAALERVADALDRAGYLSTAEIAELCGTAKRSRQGRAGPEPGTQPISNGGGRP